MHKCARVERFVGRSERRGAGEYVVRGKHGFCNFNEDESGCWQVVAAFFYFPFLASRAAGNRFFSRLTPAATADERIASEKEKLFIMKSNFARSSRSIINGKIITRESDSVGIASERMTVVKCCQREVCDYQRMSVLALSQATT